MKRLVPAALVAAVFAMCMSLQAQNVKRTYNDFEQFPCKLNEWNKASGTMKNGTDVPPGVTAAYLNSAPVDSELALTAAALSTLRLEAEVNQNKLLMPKFYATL